MYDPIHDLSPGINVQYPNSYWADISGDAPTDDGSLTGDSETDVVIIGAGYTGLSCAYHLANQHKIKPLVLEANQTAWGCSGRNAGFILNSSGRMSFTDMQQKWGDATMQGIYQEMQAGVELVNELIATGIDCDRQASGYIKIAHKASKMKALIKLATIQQQRFNQPIEVLTKQQLAQQYMDDRNAYGAIRYQNGFGLNPLKLAWGYHRLARQAGASIHTGSTVLSIKPKGKGYQLELPQGNVYAQKVVLATNGYTPKAFHPIVTNRSLPVLSQIIVTEQ